MYQALEDENLWVFLTASEQVVFEGDLVMRTIYNKSTEFYLIIRAGLQTFDNLYGKRFKFHLILCKEMDAGLLLPLEDRIHG